MHNVLYLKADSDNDLQLTLLQYLPTVGSLPELGLKTLLRGHIVLSIFITVSDLVTGVAGKGPPALFLQHVSRARAFQRDEHVSSISDTAWDCQASPSSRRVSNTCLADESCT